MESLKLDKTNPRLILHRYNTVSRPSEVMLAYYTSLYRRTREQGRAGKLTKDFSLLGTLAVFLG